MGTDAVLSGASQRADAHHRRFSRSPRLASLILSPSLTPLQLSLKPTTISLVISIPQQHRAEPRETETISLTLSVARDTCVPLFRLSNAQSLALVRALLHFRYEILPVSSHSFSPFFLFHSLVSFSIRFLIFFFFFFYFDPASVIIYIYIFICIYVYRYISIFFPISL